MAEMKNWILTIGLSSILLSCASSGTNHYYDSALNDRNRAPASIGVPVSVSDEDGTVDSFANQAQADFLFIKSELESQSGRGSETIDLLRSALVYDASSPTIMQRLAVEYYKQGQVLQAIEWASRAHELALDRRDVTLLLAGLYTTTKKYSKAEELYKKLIKADPEDSEARLYLGAVHTETQAYPKAIECFKKLAEDKSYTSRHLAYYYLARVYAEQSPNKTKRIQEELKKSIEAKPDFFESISMLAQYVQKEMGDKAVIKFYSDLQKKHGPLVKVSEVLAQHYINQNDYDSAFEQLQYIDDAAGDDLIQVKLKMALILIDKKIYDRAIVKLNEILELAPDSDKVRFYLSAVYEEKKEYQSAIDQYLKIEKDSSYFEESRMHAAYLSKTMGHLDRAIEHMKSAMSSKPENPQTYIYMSQLYEEKKELANSLKILNEATKKFDDNAQVHYYLGMLQDRMSLKTEMVSTMKKVIDIEPDHSQALNYLAYSWAESGENLDKAESYARKAVNKEKDDAYILDTLGWVMFKKGEYKKAIEILEKAHALQPEVSIIVEHLGDAYLKLKMPEKAKTHFLKAGELESDVARKKEILQKVAQIENETNSVRMPSSNSADLRPLMSP